jgi:UDP-N-acetylmuramate--alanine ligase
MNSEPRPRIHGAEPLHLHGIGIAGMGMGPLAVYLARLGFSVSGEDDGPVGPMAPWLERAGVRLGPMPANAELVFHSSAIGGDHRTLRRALEAGIPKIRRGELLAEVLRDCRVVAVCGSHGKTTTTAMLVSALRRAGIPAGHVLGGLFRDDTPPAQVGSNRWVVAEVDESDGTIDAFSPEITVVVNLDWDHPDHYQEPTDLDTTFAALFARTERCVLVSDSCPQSARIVAARVSSGSTFAAFANLSVGRTGDFTGSVAEEDALGLTLSLGGRFTIPEARVRAHGEFNGSNALAALAAFQLMGGVPSPDLLADFPGVRRRQSLVGESHEVSVIEDYAHHPAEIRSLLGSLRKAVSPAGRLMVVFQPHRFSRTAQFKAEFAAALAAADDVNLLEVYGAGESPVAGGTSADIYAELRNAAPRLPVRYMPGADSGTLRALAAEVRPGDMVAFVGAGDIEGMAKPWLESLGSSPLRAEAWDALAEELRDVFGAAGKVSREEALAGRTTLRVGGAARIYAEPADPVALGAVFRLGNSRGVPVLLLGRGSNLIVPDEGVDGIVVALSGAAWSGFAIEPDNGLRVGAGLRLKNLCGLAAREGLTGFEFLEGIPGTVGGALRMNAGAMGGWMYDVVREVSVMDRSGEIKVLPREALQVSYRHCAELEDAVAIEAVLRPGVAAEAGAVSRQMDVYRRTRQEAQPREPSAGCIFRNPPGNSAGRLIDESGLKGLRVGGAEVSSVHANFIVNRGGATSRDVLELVRQVRSRVRDATGVSLEPEVLLYGKDWREVL